MNQSGLHRTIVITGVSRGLGQAMVHEFVRLGHMVCGCARTECEITNLRRTYPAHDFEIVNVASNREVVSWANHVISKHGAPMFVLNNAAVINIKAPLWTVDEHEVSDEIDINIKGPINVIRHFVPAMIAARRGVIVNFTSRWGQSIEKYMTAYCATKWAMVATSRALAEELRKDRIAVVALNPGIVNTAMLQRYLGRSESSPAYPRPDEWARVSVPFILRLSLKDSGRVRKVCCKPASSNGTAHTARRCTYEERV